MSEVSSEFVKRGLWTNLEHGPVMGKTITTDTRTGTIIIALLAIMSTVGTAHLFHLITFLYHQWRADGKPADGLFHQQQALLRTLPGPSDLLADSMKLWWYWRMRTSRALAHSLVPFTIALLCALGSLAASILSSYVLDSTNLEVLVSSPFCGRVNTTISDTAPFRSYQDATYTVAEPYGRECYRNGTNLSARCSTFVHQNVPLTMERVACPFDDEMCVAGPDDSPSAPAVAMDSGLVDVNSAFGMNLAASDRVMYRKRTTCGVLPDDGYTTLISASEMDPTIMYLDALPGDQLMIYHYGTRPEESEWANMTVGLLLYYANYTSSYSLTAYTTFNDPKRKLIVGGHTFEPLPSMQRTDADVSYLFVAKNSVKYTSPVNDPLFSAHKGRTHLDVATYTNRTLYISDAPGGSLGCIQQYEFCIASSKGDVCTPLSGLPLTLTASDFPSANPSPVQLATLQLLITNSYLMSITDNQSFNASARLNSGGTVYSQVPNDQWVTEVVQWEQHVWAGLQIMMADYSIGPALRVADAARYVIKPETEGEKAICGVQKMRKMGGFVNINVFGLIFILTLSTLLAVIDISLLKFLVYLSRFRAALSPRIDRWIQDGVLQLQRRAFEAQGQGTWTQCNRDVPLMANGQTLEDLRAMDGMEIKIGPDRSFTGLTMNEGDSGDLVNVGEKAMDKNWDGDGIVGVTTVVHEGKRP